MAAPGNVKPAAGRAAAGSGAGATPPARSGRRVPLNSLDAVAAELARVYRDARSGAITTQDATRYAYMLATLGKALEAAQFEQRITELEAIAHEQSRTIDQA